MNLIEEAYKKILTEDFEHDGFYVYHGTKSDSLNGLGEAGLERIFTDSNGGNMYGPGVYSTYKLATGFQNTRGTYGSYLLKMKVKSLRSFIIYDKDIALKVYKNPSIDFQLRKIFTPEQYQELRNSRYVDYDKICNARGDLYTSTCALSLITSLRNYHPSLYYCINGYIFFGHNDGYVCLIEDFKNVYPVALTKDGGNTWQPFDGSDSFDKYAKNDVDIKWQLGKRNYELYKSLDEIPFHYTNNFARIIKNGKCNFLFRGKPFEEGPISPVWFDEAPETFNNKGNCLVMLGGDKLILHLDSKEKKFYVYYDDGTYLCELDDLSSVVDPYTNSLKTFSFDDDEDF
jgi:hypothetical protein